MTTSQEAREYPPLPEPAMEDVPYELWGQNVTYPALYTAEQVYACIDADRKARQQEATEAARDVLAERARQIDREGWRPERDDTYTRSELSAVACAYILASRGFSRGAIRDFIWPESWTFSWFKPTNERRDLVKAGALILAEIERLDRAAIAKGERHE